MFSCTIETKDILFCHDGIFKAWAFFSNKSKVLRACGWRVSILLWSIDRQTHTHVILLAKDAFLCNTATHIWWFMDIQCSSLSCCLHLIDQNVPFVRCMTGWSTWNDPRLISICLYHSRMGLQSRNNTLKCISFSFLIRNGCIVFCNDDTRHRRETERELSAVKKRTKAGSPELMLCQSLPSERLGVKENTESHTNRRRGLCCTVSFALSFWQCLS